MPKTISVIVIDIPSHIYTSSTDAKKYASLSAISKLAILADHIDKLMSGLEKTEPDVLHVITWREYGISGADSKFVTLEEKNLIKKTLRDLAQKYPSLVIVSGTIACVKHFENFSIERFNTIEKDYAHLQGQGESEQQITFHLKQLQEIKPGNKISVLEEDGSVEEEHVIRGAKVIRNTCYIIQRSITKRHDKTTPHIETVDYSGEQLQNAVFRPGKSTTRNPIIYVIHPETKEKVSLGIEICFEHQNKVLKMMAKNNLLDLHLILSDFTRTKLQNCCAAHVIYVDSYHEPKMILTQKITGPDNVKFYCVYGLHQPDILNQPVIPLLPFQAKISGDMAAVIDDCPPFHPDHEMLMDLKATWDEVADECTLKFQLANNLKVIMGKLDNHIENTKSNQIKNFYSLFYTASPAETLLYELRKQYKTFMNDVHPGDPLNYKDILAIRPADVQFVKNKNRPHSDR